MTKEEMKTKALAILGYDEKTPLSGIEICYKKSIVTQEPQIVIADENDEVQRSLTLSDNNGRVGELLVTILNKSDNKRRTLWIDDNGGLYINEGDADFTPYQVLSYITDDNNYFYFMDKKNSVGIDCTRDTIPSRTEDILGNFYYLTCINPFPVPLNELNFHISVAEGKEIVRNLVQHPAIQDFVQQEYSYFTKQFPGLSQVREEEFKDNPFFTSTNQECQLPVIIKATLDLLPEQSSPIYQKGLH